MLDIPIYRAKKLNTNKYVLGYLFPDDNKNPEIYRIQGKNKVHEIDPRTLSIHFHDRLDKNGKRIFASLDSETGLGGDQFLKNYYYTVIFHDGAVKYLSHHGDITLNIQLKDICIMKGI